MGVNRYIWVIWDWSWLKWVFSIECLDSAFDFSIYRINWNTVILIWSLNVLYSPLLCHCLVWQSWVFMFMFGLQILPIFSLYFRFLCYFSHYSLVLSSLFLYFFLPHYHYPFRIIIYNFCSFLCSVLPVVVFVSLCSWLCLLVPVPFPTPPHSTSLLDSLSLPSPIIIPLFPVFLFSFVVSLL